MPLSMYLASHFPRALFLASRIMEIKTGRRNHAVLHMTTLLLCSPILSSPPSPTLRLCFYNPGGCAQHRMACFAFLRAKSACQTSQTLFQVPTSTGVRILTPQDFLFLAPIVQMFLQYCCNCVGKSSLILGFSLSSAL